MSSSAIIVSLNPQECVLPDFGDIVPRAGVDEFFFVGREERLGDGIVEALSG